MHLCRGNRGGQWHAEGSYETVAERLFNTLDIDSSSSNTIRRDSGDFTPLRLVPKGSPSCSASSRPRPPALEDKAALKHRVEDASRFVDLDRLAVSPQCGFASLDTGNPITPQAQEQKLRLIVELAQELWGTA